MGLFFWAALLLAGAVGVILWALVKLDVFSWSQLFPFVKQ